MADINISLAPQPVAMIGDFPITNSLWVSVMTSVGLILLFWIVGRRMKQVPGKTQLFLETFVTGSYDFVDGITGNKKVTSMLFPLFTTLAVFFLAANLIGFLPFWAPLTVGDTPLFRSPTTDYSLVFALTMVLFIVWQMVAVVTGGVFRYLWQYKNPLDLIGEVAKIVSLSFRLFGNIFAGEVIATIFLVLAPYVVPVPFYALSLLSSVIQAFVFPILVLIFINMAIVTKEDIQEELKKKELKKQKRAQKRAAKAVA
jgi:F-type H+-transporting ATPase subunit a